MSNKKLVDLLSLYLNDEFGITITSQNKIYIENFVKDNINTLEESINQTFMGFQIDSILNVEKVSNLLSCFDPEIINKLVNDITINETYFFRDQSQIDFVKKDLVRRINSNSDQKITIWSLGCSSGEEPYTLAILCDELGISEYVDIYAFDINTDVLKKAREGIYTNWSFRGMDTRYIDSYFTQIDKNSFKLSDKIIKKVSFKEFNLKKDLFNQEIMKGINKPDIIFCRNILMYFSENEIIKIANFLENILKINGYLITSAQETFVLKSTHFKKVFKDGVFIFYKRKSLVKYKSDYEENSQKEVLKLYNKEALNDYVQKNSQNKQKILKNIFSLIEKKDYFNSDILCDLLIENDPYDFINYLIKGKVLFLLNDLDSSENYLKKALFLNTYCVISHYEYSKILISTNRIDKAKKHLKKAFRILSKNIDLQIENNLFKLLKINKYKLLEEIECLLEEVSLENV